MADNHPDDKYLYEIVVETGPKDSHATTAKIHFILAGNDEETDVRSVFWENKTGLDQIQDYFKMSGI